MINLRTLMDAPFGLIFDNVSKTMYLEAMLGVYGPVSNYGHLWMCISQRRIDPDKVLLVSGALKTLGVL